MSERSGINPLSLGALTFLLSSCCAIDSCVISCAHSNVDAMALIIHNFFINILICICFSCNDFNIVLVVIDYEKGHHRKVLHTSKICTFYQKLLRKI
jgi:hypothetical protein